MGLQDSQTVRTTEKGGPPGSIVCDVHKSITSGRERHLLVDTLDYVSAIVVHGPAVQDKTGAYQSTGACERTVEPAAVDLADGGCEGQAQAWAQDRWGSFLGPVKRPLGLRGWQLLPRRWFVERTFAWLGRFRRLGKDCEFLPETSEALIRVAMIHLIVRRLTRLRRS